MENKAVLSGNLDFISLGDVLQLLGVNGSTGILRIFEQSINEPAAIYLDKGNPVNAVHGSVKGIDALFPVFGWINGRFEFFNAGFNIKKKINKNRMEIILDGLRMLDEGKIKKVSPEAGKITQVNSSNKSKNDSIINGPLVDYVYVVDEEEFNDGDIIISEGKFGNWIWVVLEGAVEIVKQTPKGITKILRIGSGAFVGSLSAIILQGSTRTATTRAVGKVQLGVLDSQRISSEYSLMSDDFKKITTSLDNRLKAVTQRVADIEVLASDGKEDFADKKLLIKQGNKEERLFVIMEGEAIIAKKTKKGYNRLTTLRKGDFFGNIPFLCIGHEPYSASVFATENIKVRVLDPGILQKEFEQQSSTIKNIINTVGTCISVTSVVACEEFVGKIK